MKIALIITALVMGLILMGSAIASTTGSKLTPEQFLALAMNGESGPTTAKGTIVTSAPSWVPTGAPVTTKGVSGPAAPATVCWTMNDQMWHEWGTWPEQQRVLENRYWCAGGVGGAQNYRVSHVLLHSTACDTSNAYGYLVDGGNGWSWATVRSGGHFHCPSPIPYLSFNSDAWQEWACNTWGNCSLVRTHRDT